MPYTPNQPHARQHGDRIKSVPFARLASLCARASHYRDTQTSSPTVTALHAARAWHAAGACSGSRPSSTAFGPTRPSRTATAAACACALQQRPEHAARALEGVGNVTHAENENGRVSTKKKTPAQKKGRNFFFGRSAAEDNR